MDQILIPHEETTHPYRSWPWWRWGLTGLSALALALSAYLGWHDLGGQTVIGCGGGSPCDRVLNSRWATVGGVLPVSGLAAGTYLAILVASLAVGPATTAPVRQLAWRAMLVLVGAVAGSAVWFTVVQKWIIGAFCPYCLATHSTGVLLAALVVWRAPRQVEQSEVRNPKPERGGKLVAVTSKSRLVGSSEASRFWIVDRFRFSVFGFRVWPLVGLALAGILAVSQAALTPPPVSRGGASQNDLPGLDPHAVPLIGLPDAPNVVALLFDYQCVHCQRLHFLLEEAIRRYGSTLAVALCPTPLNSNCNPHMPRDADEFKDSCELARVGLAVWVARRDVFPDFARWMFSFETGDRWHPRSLDAARTKAVELVGQANYDAALVAPWIDRYLQTSIRIYGATSQSGNGAIPKLVFGSRWVVPEPNDAEDLVVILQNRLAVPKP